MAKIATGRNALATKMQKMCFCGVVIDKWLTICYLVGEGAPMNLRKPCAAVEPGRSDNESGDSSEYFPFTRGLVVILCG